MEKSFIEKNGILYITEFSKFTPDEHKFKELWYIADYKPDNLDDFNSLVKLSKKKIYQDYLGVQYKNTSNLTNNYSSW